MVLLAGLQDLLCFLEFDITEENTEFICKLSKGTNSYLID